MITPLRKVGLLKNHGDKLWNFGYWEIYEKFMQKKFPFK